MGVRHLQLCIACAFITKVIAFFLAVWGIGLNLSYKWDWDKQGLADVFPAMQGCWCLMT